VENSKKVTSISALVRFASDEIRRDGENHCTEFQVELPLLPVSQQHTVHSSHLNIVTFDLLVELKVVD